MAAEYDLYTIAGVDADRIVTEVHSLDPTADVDVFDEPDTSNFGPYTTMIACYGTADPETVAQHLQSTLRIEVLTLAEVDRKLGDVPAPRAG